MATIKDKAYWLVKFQNVLQGRIPGINFREFDPLTALMAADATFAGEQWASAQAAEDGFFYATASLEQATLRGTGNDGIPPKTAIPATLTAIITRGAAAVVDIVIPANTMQVATNPDPTTNTRILFNVITDTHIAIGSNTSDPVSLEAVVGGTNGNILAGTPLVIVTGGNLVDRAQALTNGVGGVDAETVQDYTARLRLELRSRSKGTAAAFVAAALSVPQIKVAYVSEDPITGNVTVQAARADGTLTFSPIPNADSTQIGIALQSVRALGIVPSIALAPSTHFVYRIVIEYQPGTSVSTQQATQQNILSELNALFSDMNNPILTARKIRANAVREIVLAQQPQVVDITEAVFQMTLNGGSPSPVATVDLNVPSPHVAVLDAITWV